MYPSTPYFFTFRSLAFSLLTVFSTLSFANGLLNAPASSVHNKAEQAMAKGNFAIAYCLWAPLAEKGESKAQFNVGWMFHNGYGLTIDDQTAFQWWIKSAEQGYTDSFYALADLYLAGFGVEEDKDIAMGWYIAAAKRGHAPSIEVLQDLPLRNNAISKKYFTLLLKEEWSIFKHPRLIKVDKANLRKGPGTQHAVVTSLPKGYPLIAIQQVNGWTHVGITDTDKTAWIFSKLLAPVSEPLKP